MRWEDERYVRSYTRDTPGWVMLPWQGKVLQKLLERKLDRAGVLDLAEYAGSQMVEVLAVMVGLPEEVVAVGLPALLRRQTFVLHGQFLVMPNFIDAQECTSSPKARAKAMRERARDLARAENLGVLDSSRNVTAPSRLVSAPSRNVTVASETDVSTHEPSRNVTVPNDPYALPPGETDEEVPEDLGQVPGTVTKRDAALQNATPPSQDVTEPIANGVARHSVPYRAVPYRAEPGLNGTATAGENSPNPADGLVAVPTGDAVIAARIEAEIRKYDVFGPLDAYTLARRQADHMMTARSKLEWVIAAIEKCAAENEGLGLKEREVQKALIQYMRRANEHDLRKGPTPVAPSQATTTAPPQKPKEFDLSQYEGLRAGKSRRS